MLSKQRVKPQHSCSPHSCCCHVRANLSQLHARFAIGEHFKWIVTCNQSCLQFLLRSPRQLPHEERRDDPGSQGDLKLILLQLPSVVRLLGSRGGQSGKQLSMNACLSCFG